MYEASPIIANTFSEPNTDTQKANKVELSSPPDKQTATRSRPLINVLSF